ncbi:MAG: tetratricopeptide repeat protein [Deltaproteobacteria bacterium]|nr:tetratricopeptide repeat protein [Deltaproteobacteria bacterium]
MSPSPVPSHQGRGTHPPPLAGGVRGGGVSQEQKSSRSTRRNIAWISKAEGIVFCVPLQQTFGRVMWLRRRLIMRLLMVIALLAAALVTHSLTPCWALTEDEISELVRQGRLALDSKGFARGVDIFSRLIIADPRAEFFYLRGLAYQALEQYGPSISDLANAVSLSPGNALYHLAMGLAQLGNAQFKEAVDSISGALKLDPDNPEALLYRARAYLNLGIENGALQDLERAIKLMPEDAELYRLRGDALSLAGNYARAVSDYTAALRLKPTDCASLNNRGVALANLGRTREAVDDLEGAMKLALSAPPTITRPEIPGSPW